MEKIDNKNVYQMKITFTDSRTQVRLVNTEFVGLGNPWEVVDV